MFPLSSVSWEVSALICVSQSLIKGGNLSDLDLSPEVPISSRCWRPLGLMCNQFLSSPKCYCHYTRQPVDVTCQGRLWWPAVAYLVSAFPWCHHSSSGKSSIFANCIVFTPIRSFTYFSVLCLPRRPPKGVCVTQGFSNWFTPLQGFYKKPL